MARSTFMSAKSPGLEGRLAAEIDGCGAVTFERFMELALYAPEGGYYAGPGSRVGKRGDFITSVSFGPIFGEVLSGQFLEAWEGLGCPEDFAICEQGGNDGAFAADVRKALASTPLAGVRWIFIEPMPHLKKAQQERLQGTPTEWVSSVDELPEFCGVHFSNELFDALPVHVVRSDGDRWNELRVDRSGDAFVWTEATPPPDVREALADFPIRPAGFTTEVCTRYAGVLEGVGSRMKRGLLLAIDYGLTTEALLAAHRLDGTLRCYSGHRQDSLPLEAPGRKDLTAHVNFSHLVRDALKTGWEPRALADQHHFLVGAARKMLLALDGHPNPAKLRPLVSLLHPENMGRQFQAILFSKGCEGIFLSGFQHARESDLMSCLSFQRKYPANPA